MQHRFSNRLSSSAFILSILFCCVVIVTCLWLSMWVRTCLVLVVLFGCYGIVSCVRYFVAVAVLISLFIAETQIMTFEIIILLLMQ